MNVIAPIFKDPTIQSLFEKDGFVKVPLLGMAQVDELVSLYDGTRAQHATVPTLHHTTTDTQNDALIRMVDAKIRSVFANSLDTILTNYKPLVGCLHIKEPGESSQTGIHQDPTFVDESKYCSANVWVALQDIGEHNGNLFFIPGSNAVSPGLRVTPDFPPYYAGFRASLPEMSVHVPLKKGEAVIFNNATIHGATPNRTENPRLAATLLVSSKPADWLVYYQDKNTPNDKIEEYLLDMPTFISASKNGRPEGKSPNRFVPAVFPQVSKEEFIKKTGREPVSSGGYLQKFKNIFRSKSAV